MQKICWILLPGFLLAFQCRAQDLNALLLGKKPGHTNTLFASGACSAVDSFQHKNVVYVPADFGTKHLGFFCKQELKIEQAHLPVKIRLGGLEYCNWIEQKPGYRTAGLLYNY